MASSVPVSGGCPCYCVLQRGSRCPSRQRSSPSAPSRRAQPGSTDLEDIRNMLKQIMVGWTNLNRKDCTCVISWSIKGIKQKWRWAGHIYLRNGSIEPAAMTEQTSIQTRPACTVQSGNTQTADDRKNKRKQNFWPLEGKRLCTVLKNRNTYLFINYR